MLASAAAVLARVPLVYHIHSPASADTTSRLRNWASARLERVGLAAADHLVAVSRSLRQRYLGLGLAPERITTVPNGVPCGSRLPTRRRLPGEPCVFAVVALFRPRKGLEVLLQSTADLLAAGHPVRLRAIGRFESTNYERQIKNLAMKLGLNGAIDWTGFCSDFEQQLDRAHCLVLPSLFGEGLPMVVLEAMARGRPVIATNVEGVPEAIRHGENGLLAEPGDPASLALQMKRVVDGAVDLQALAQRATEDQRQYFSVCSMTAGVADVYDRVLGIAPLCREIPCLGPALVSQDALGGEFATVPLDGFSTSQELPA